MAIDPSQIDSQLFERAQQLAREQHCTVDEVLAAALAHVKQTGSASGDLRGLFADDPQVIDQVLADAYKSREHDPLRPAGDG